MTFILAATIASIAATTVTVYGQIETGKAADEAAKIKAENERVAAESRELERQQELKAALTANAVGMGVSGIKTEGTPASIALESAENVSLSEGMTKLSDRLVQAQILRQGADAKSASQFAAAGTLLSGASNAYKMNA